MTNTSFLFFLLSFFSLVFKCMSLEKGQTRKLCLLIIIEKDDYLRRDGLNRNDRLGINVERKTTRETIET